MKLYIKDFKVFIISNKVSNVLAWVSGLYGKRVGKPAMGFAMFPCFIILRNITHSMTEQWINHESIHIRQFIESFGVFWIYSKLEYLYARIFLKYTHYKAYIYEGIEQEAYLNQHNLEYLRTRPAFNTFKYFKEKRVLKTDKNYHVVLVTKT